MRRNRARNYQLPPQRRRPLAINWNQANRIDRERLANIFRTVHTVKGTSGFLDFPKLERVAHVGENLLVPLRDGELELNNEIVDSLLGMVDVIREILGNFVNFCHVWAIGFSKCDPRHCLSDDRMVAQVRDHHRDVPIIQMRTSRSE